METAVPTLVVGTVDEAVDRDRLKVSRGIDAKLALGLDKRAGAGDEEIVAALPSGSGSHLEGKC